MDSHYSMNIKWSHSSQVFVAHVPEFPGLSAHGNTYAQAAEEAEKAIELFVDQMKADGVPLPRPMVLK